MKSGHYDIVRRENESPLRWLESADDLNSAKSRILELTSFWPGEFQVLDHDSHQIVAATDMSRRQPRQVVSETRPEIEGAV